MYGPWQSQIPAATKALTASVREYAATLTHPPAIHFGPFTGAGSDTHVLVIGWVGFAPGYTGIRQAASEDIGTAAVISDSAQEGLGPSSRETFAINCASLVRSGGTHETDVDFAVSDAYTQIAVVGQVLQAPPWISGTVLKAEMAPASALSLVQDRRGLLAIVTFDIRCIAFAAQ